MYFHRKFSSFLYFANSENQTTKYHFALVMEVLYVCFMHLHCVKALISKSRFFLILATKKYFGSFCQQDSRHKIHIAIFTV